MIHFGRLYLDKMLKVYYVIIKYYENGVPGTPLKGPLYEVMKVNDPDSKSYAAVTTVESWKLVE